MTRRTTVLWLALALAGCGAKDQTKRYAMEGEVKALDPATKSATIAHGKIGDWMEAMTMEYAVKPDAEFQKLFVGARIPRSRSHQVQNEPEKSCQLPLTI